MLLQFYLVATAEHLASFPEGSTIMSGGVVITIVIGTVAFLVNLIAIFVATYRMGRAVEKFEQIGLQQAGEISALKKAVESVADLMTQTALQSQRLDNLSARVTRNDQLIDDLRRGEGMILPLEAAMKKFHGSGDR